MFKLAPGGRTPGAVRVRVWDLPTRVFHWGLVLVVGGALVTAQIGGNLMVWHMRLGLAVLALLAFRLVWGLIGGRWSRFVRFTYSPAAVLRYLRGREAVGDHFEVGHNPLGTASVWAMLLLLAFQVATGLMADDEIADAGPLALRVGEDVASAATGLHTQWGQPLIYVLLSLHVAAIVWYRLRRVDLVRPMVTGDKWLPSAVPESRDTVWTRLLALVVVAICSAAAVWINGLGA
jgi:cytochrome b